MTIKMAADNVDDDEEEDVDGDDDDDDCYERQPIKIIV